MKKSFPGYSNAFFLKSRSTSMKGSFGSSIKNSKFLKKRSSQLLAKSFVKGFEKLCRLSQLSNRLLQELGLLIYSNASILGGGCRVILRIFRTCGSPSSLRVQMILRFLGWRIFLFLTSLSGLNSLTQALRIPTFSSRLLRKSNLQNSPNLSWQQQSSSDFFETPTALAASCRLTFFIPALRLLKCTALHCRTIYIVQPMVRSLLRSFFSRTSEQLESKPLSDSLLPPSSSAFLNLIMITLAQKRQAGIFALRSAPILLREAKRLVSGSQIEILFVLSGQNYSKRSQRSTCPSSMTISISSRRDCCVYYFSKTKVRLFSLKAVKFSICSLACYLSSQIFIQNNVKIIWGCDLDLEKLLTASNHIFGPSQRSKPLQFCRPR